MHTNFSNSHEDSPGDHKETLHIQLEHEACI